MKLDKYILLWQLGAKRLELALSAEIHAFLQSHWQKAAGSRTILVVVLAGRWLAWLTSSHSVPLGSQGDNQCVSLPASWLSEWQMDLQAAWLAACLALLLPDGWFTCCPAPQMPGRLPAQFAWSWVRLWAQNSLYCKAGDCSVDVSFSSNIWTVPWSRNSHPSKL